MDKDLNNFEILKALLSDGYTAKKQETTILVNPNDKNPLFVFLSKEKHADIKLQFNSSDWNIVQNIIDNFKK
jgi:hypothetical protein